MPFFFSDLDNTIIYSYKKNIGSNKIIAEIYNNREISFITEYTYLCLNYINSKIKFIPVTTRSVEQYKRVVFNKNWKPEFALATNGGNLIVNGVVDENYRKKTLEIIEPFIYDMNEIRNALKLDTDIILDVILVDGMFVYTKSQAPNKTLERLKIKFENSKVDFISNNQKIYAVPPVLKKGFAVERIKEYICLDRTISAGDSVFDISMLNNTEVSIFPDNISRFITKKDNIFCFNGKEIFSDYVMDKVISEVL